jgi:two-component system, chemotaxis family, chemotaxis protein CheY
MVELKGSVLIVDDDRYLVETLSQALTEEGYFVVGASDGADAITCLNLVDYNLILLDLHMPRLGGRELAQLLKGLSMKIPVVIMTGHSNAGRFAEEMELAGYLEKPFGLNELFKTVGSYCKPIRLS